MATKRTYIGAVWNGPERVLDDGTVLTPGETLVESVGEPEAKALDDWTPKYQAAKGSDSDG